MSSVVDTLKRAVKNHLDSQQAVKELADKLAQKKEQQAQQPEERKGS